MKASTSEEITEGGNKRDNHILAISQISKSVFNNEKSSSTNINDIISFNFGPTAVSVNLLRKGAFAIYTTRVI